MEVAYKERVVVVVVVERVVSKQTDSWKRDATGLGRLKPVDSALRSGVSIEEDKARESICRRQLSAERKVGRTLVRAASGCGGARFVDLSALRWANCKWRQLVTALPANQQQRRLTD